MSRLKDFLVPHEGNNFTPHSLEKWAVGVMLLMILFTFTVANLQSMWWVSSEWLVSTVLPAVVISETNQERQTSSLLPVTRSEVLDRAATLKAEHMASQGYFAHYSPTGISPWYWFGVADYNFIHAGENLAVHFNDSSQVVQAWMDSPTHRANILNGQYEEIGIGVAKGEYEGFDTVFVVQLFGTPLRAEAVPASVAVAEEPTESLEPFVSTAASVPTTIDSAPVNTPTSAVSGAEVRMTVTEAKALSSQQTDLATVNETETALASAISGSSTPTTVTTIMAADGESWYAGESFIATTTASGTVPASVAFTESATPDAPPSWAVAATQPGSWLQLVFAGMAGIVTVLLLLAVGIEIRRQHPVQVAYAFGLLFMLGGLWWLHTSLVGTILIV